MTDDTTKLKSRISTLSRLLDEFDSQLEPLLAQSLPEALLPLSTIQQAKLQVTVPYLVYDLIIIYLKTRGIDPRTHPVFTELERVRHYTEKISNAENPETRKTSVDKAAANRFIKHAITQVKDQKQQDDTAPPQASTSAVRVPVKVTSKMLARAQYEEELKESLSEEGEELEVFDSKDSDSASSGESGPKAKGKAIDIAQQDEEEAQPTNKKRRRRPMDPFADYGDKDTIPASRSSQKRKKMKNEEHSQPQDVSTLESSQRPVKAHKEKRKPRHKSLLNTTG